jgi:xanthine dehydrogenase YagS FAD-binding subunit
MITSDLMPPFELYQPATLREALGLLDRYGGDAWKLAGGNDSLDWFKARLKRPRAVIDLTSIEGLAGIRTTAGGVEIGATTTLSALARDPLVRARFRLLADAALRVASPQIRNSGTIGGNIAQHARCLYYRSGLPCLRAGGERCFAQNQDSVTREHALFDIGRCLAVNPSDVAPALAALDARMVLRSSAGVRIVDADEFFVGVRTDVTSLNCIRPEEILVAIRLPDAWAGAHFYFEKVADRKVWDFALVNVAAAMRVDNGRIESARIVCGAVSATPRRLPVVEEAITGKAKGARTAALAGELATAGAVRLTYNGFKVPLMAGLVTRAVREAKA